MVRCAVPKTTRRPHLTANNRLLWPVVEALRASKLDIPRALADVGLDEEATNAPDGRVSLDQLYQVWRFAVERTGDTELGLKLSVFSNPSFSVSWPMPLALLEHLGMSSASLADAIVTQNRFMRLLHDGLRFYVEADGPISSVRMEVPAEEPSALIDLNMAVALNLGRRITRRELPLTEVWLTHGAPADPMPYREFFGANVRFSAPFNALFGPTEEFQRPLPTHSDTFKRRVTQHAEKLLAALPSLDFFEDRVCAQIEAELPDGNTNAAAVAEKLGVSARTLHRRLQQEGTSYQDLLDRVRFRLAVRYLGAGRTVAEVAQLVGFAQASTFHRAFKSWTGETPAEYQEHHGSPASPASIPPNANGAT